jgi:hypothetical protein
MLVALPPPQGNGSLRAFVRRALSDDPNPTLGARGGDTALWRAPWSPLSNSGNHALWIWLFESGRERISEHPVKPQSASVACVKPLPTERSGARSRIELSASSVISERSFQSLTSLETPRSVLVDTQKTRLAADTMASTAVLSGVSSGAPREHFPSATTATPNPRIVSRRMDIAPASRRPNPPGRIPEKTCNGNEFPAVSAQARSASHGGVSFRATRSAPKSPELSPVSPMSSATEGATKSASTRTTGP